MSIDHWPKQTAIRTDLGAIFVSLELSRSVWLITSLSPRTGEKMSKHSVRSGDMIDLLRRLAQLKEKARVRIGQIFPIIVIQEVGLDGFWIYRVLQREGFESYVVDPASIAVSRRRRRAKTDRIEGEALVRTLMAYKRGEPWVCAMVKAPSPQEEDRRRLVREGFVARMGDLAAEAGWHRRAGPFLISDSTVPFKSTPLAGMTCWRRLRDWQAAGVWARLHRTLLERLADADKLDWSRASLDSAAIGAKKGALRPARTRRIAANRARSAMLWSTGRARRSA